MPVNKKTKGCVYMRTKKKILTMVIVIIILQGLLPILGIVFENCFTIISKGTTEWDISQNEDGTVKAVLDEETGTLTIEGTGAMKNWNSSSSVPWKNVRESIQKVIIKEGVTSIGSYAFSGCSSLTSINIPEGVTNIVVYAFKDCSSLTSINIPSSVTSIGGSAFEGCSSLTSINVNESNKKYSSESGILFNKNKTEIIKYPIGKKETTYTIPSSVTSIGSAAFADCSSLMSIEIPEGVTSIEYSAFFFCSSLTSIEIPSSVTSIGSEAFYYCSSLTSINIPEGVTNIGSRVFCGCSSLTSIEIPSSVTSIGDGAFSECSSLTSISVDENNKNYSSENGVLFNKEKTSLICYPTGKKDTTYKIPSRVTSIGDCAFEGCSSLTSIEIPEGVTSIGSYAFSGCSSLTSIEIPEGVTIIGIYAFSGCSSLTSINIPEGITSIRGSAFILCSSLESIEIPSSVTSIGSDAFYGCSSLTSINIPEGVTSIGNSAFYGCNSNLVIYCRSNSYTKEYAENNSIKYLEVNPEITSVTGNPENWTKEDVTLTVTAQDDLYGLASEPYSFDGGTTWQKENTKVYSQNTNGIIIKVKCKDGAIATYEIINITKIDKDAPTIEKVEGNPSDWTKEDVTLTITGAKDTLSGLASEAYSFDGGATWQKENTKVYSQNTNGIVIKVKDNLGNTYTHGTINITKIDKEAPTIEKVEGNPSDWTKEDVTLTITGAKDTLSGLASEAYSFDGGATWQKENTKVYSQNTEGIVIKVKDNLGNTYTHETINITKIRKPESIKVTTLPTKTTYHPGENFDKTGMVVTLVYDNKMEEEITNYTVLNGTDLKYGGQKITIQYNEDTAIKTELTIQVDHAWNSDTGICTICNKACTHTTDSGESSWDYERRECRICGVQLAIISIDVEQSPNKTYYFVGDEVDLDGMILTATYNDGYEETITSGFSYSPLVLKNSGWQPITIKYEQLMTDIYVNVEDVKVTSINVTTLPNKTNYQVGEQFDPTGMVIEAVWNTGKKEETTNYTVINGENLTCSQDKIEIQYNENTAIKTEIPITIPHTEVIDKAVEATCTEKGLTEGKHCSVCNEVIVAQEVIPAKGHTLEIIETVEATCLDEGSIEYECSVCGETETTVIPAKGHTEVIDKAVAPTCTETGLTEGKHCSVCNEVIVAQEVEPALGHSFTNYVSNNDATCTKDGTKTAKCDRCEVTDTKADEGSKKPHTEVIDKAVEATCTETGLTEGKHCSVCNTVITAQETVPATGHTEVIDKAVAPTCTETGLTEGKHCSVCNEVIVAQEVEPALGHSFTNYVSNNDATCTKDGTKTAKCDRCEVTDTKADEGSKKPHTEVIDKAVEATCTETGLTEGKHCSVCNEVIVAQEVEPALGHSFTNYVSNNDATCTKDGTKTAKCDRCEVTDTKADEGSKKPHTEVIDKAVEATCTEKGLTEGKHCSVCNEVIVAQEVIPAKGHTEVIDQAIAPTCTETGLTEGKHCSVCNTVIKAQETVPAKGHTEVIDKAVEATCTKPGLTEGKHCSVCNTIIKAQETVPAKGHTEVIDEAVAPTCTETGLTEGKHCSVCNTVITAQTTVPALGHSYENGECIRCGEEEPEVKVTSEKYSISSNKIARSKTRNNNKITKIRYRNKCK